MKKNNFSSLILLLFLFSLIIISCDNEKYFSFNLSSSTGSDSTTIQGYVLRYDSNIPIDSAYVQIGYNRVLTDSTGFFQVGILYNQDDNRNSLSPIIIKAKKYVDYYGKVLVLPTPQDFKFSLIWRVPIVEASALVINPAISLQKIVQARIKDYEGIDDIDSVYTFFTFAELYDTYGNVVRPSEVIVLPFFLVQKIDALTGMYQTKILEREILHGKGVIPYAVIAVDKNGYKKWITKNYIIKIPEEPIYPVDWYDEKK